MEKIFDSHLHIIDARFPLVPNDGFVPKPFTCADYRKRVAGLNIAGGAVVSGSFQAFDQGYLVAALEALGPAFVGVTQLPASASDEEIRRLDVAGVRAVRFNLQRGGSATASEMEALARRAYAVAGWHAELYVDARALPPLAETIARLPVVSIDHFGLSGAGFPALVRLVEQGAFVKLTGFGRLDFDPRNAIRALADVNPEALLFGTDLPSTRAARPFHRSDVDLVREALGPKDAARAFFENAAALYRPRLVRRRTTDG